MAEDKVNHPKHYAGYPVPVECIDVTRHLSFRLGNAFKYVWRAGRKGGSYREDLEKALWYLEDLQLFPYEEELFDTTSARAVFNLIPKGLFGFNSNRFHALRSIVENDPETAEAWVNLMLRMADPSVTSPEKLTEK